MVGKRSMHVLVRDKGSEVFTRAFLNNILWLRLLSKDGRTPVAAQARLSRLHLMAPPQRLRMASVQKLARKARLPFMRTSSLWYTPRRDEQDPYRRHQPH